MFEDETPVQARHPRLPGAPILYVHFHADRVRDGVEMSAAIDEAATGIRAILSRPGVYELWSQAVGGERGRSTIAREHARTRPGDRVLDLGCGPGAWRSYLGDVQYVGIDLSEAYIARAREHFGESGEFHVGDVTVIDDRLHGFDLVTALGVLHHLDHDGAQRMLAGAAQALNPRGRLVTIDPTFATEQSRLARMVISRDRGQHVRPPSGYTSLAEPIFASVRSSVRHDLLRIPYSHCILECQSPVGR
jgi:SAM-dependent methyltransferase